MSMSLTFTLNFTTLILIFLALASGVSWIVRYRLGTSTNTLPQLEQRKESQLELFPDAQAGDSKPGLSSYLDEFLSAIKIFGYLEKNVFHELTRTMQTRKLIAGETMQLDDQEGFSLVVDGMVQIFVKSTQHDGDAEDQGSHDEDEYQGRSQGYQLLTEVKNGAPMSSLFTILKLFTKDTKLRHGDDSIAGLDSGASMASDHPRPPSAFMRGTFTPESGATSPVQLPQSSVGTTVRRRRTSSLASPTAGGRLPSVPPLLLNREAEEHEEGAARTTRRRSRTASSAHPDIVARARTDTTIAVIPASAFKRLTHLYPRASAHIVQVILTRLQRVTMTTSHTYLGLTSEVLRTERLMNKYTTYDLPDFLKDAPLARLKEKFARERERIGSEEDMKGIALHNPGFSRRRRSSSSLRREAAAHARLAAARVASPASPHTNLILPVSSPDVERNGVSAGDLLTNTRPGRLSFSQPLLTPAPSRRIGRFTADQNYFSTAHGSSQDSLLLHRQESLDEDSMFREAILDSMLKAIGLSKTNTPPRPDSVEQSPRLVSFDSRRQKAVFGFMDPYGTATESDSESMASASVSALSSGGSHNMLEELVNDIEILFFREGAVLVEQGERNPGLYYVIDGFLDVSIPVEEQSGNSSIFNESSASSGTTFSELYGTVTAGTSPSRMGSVGITGHSARKRKARKSLFLTKPGGLAGYLGTVSSYKSFVDVTAKSDVYCGFISKASIDKIVERYPIVLLTMAKRLTTLLPRLLTWIDFALEWMQVNAGQVVYNQGDESDAIYIVLNGRLRAVQGKKDGIMTAVGEYGQNDSVGELEVLTETTRPASLHAIRDTELVKVPKPLFNSLAHEHPGITIRISKLIATRTRALLDKPPDQDRTTAAASRNKIASTVNLRTVAILPVTAGVPVVEFGNRLVNALTQIGTPNGVMLLQQATILNHLGRHAFNRMGKLKLSQYLADLEVRYGLVLYVADTTVQSPWTQTCINQADCILLVGIAEASTDIGEYERLLLTTKTTARKELVLLHAERYSPPGLTRRWLRNRMWISGSHHHIQMSYRTTPEPVHPQARRFGSAIKQRVQVLQAEIQKYTSRRVRQTPLYSAETPFKGDFHRLARRLCGKAVGLVLGGGGARGIAHIGVIRALEEAGIPIDIVGGTSIGSFIGALYAWDADVVPMYGRAKKFAGRMGSMWRFALDLTYPAAAYTTGQEFNRGILKTFGNSQIEDFWLEFYCNTTNISRSRQEIHTSGYVWRYVRASMSLAGLLPPLCDQGDMLLDGGYIDNLTVAHMQSFGADAIFAVDVGAVDTEVKQQYGDSLSGFWSLLNRYNPFSAHPNPPTLSEIQARLAYVSSVDALERAKAMPGCRYMRPPIDAYGTLEFAKFEEIYRVGYEYGKRYLASLKEQGDLPITEGSEEERKNLWRTMAPRRASI